MAATSKFILRSELGNFLRKLDEEHDVFYPTSSLEYAKFVRESGDATELDRVRSAVPMKAFFMRQGENPGRPESSRNRFNIIFGAKACDLAAKKIMDEMFLKGVCVDPGYEFYNSNTLIFSSDCPRPLETCFCNLVGGKPYAQSSDYPFDLNFSPAENGFVVDVGTERGNKIIAGNGGLFRDATAGEIALREKSRKDAVGVLEEANSGFLGLKGMKIESVLKDRFGASAWEESSRTCVQCGGCNNACPSCYCFYLGENVPGVGRGQLPPKTRFWDACHYTGYGRVAGEANSRPRLVERFRNRYQCKFNYRKENFGVYACTGCGRCITVCPGKIDIRETLSKVAGGK